MSEWNSVLQLSDHAIREIHGRVDREPVMAAYWTAMMQSKSGTELAVNFHTFAHMVINEGASPRLAEELRISTNRINSSIGLHPI